MILMGIDEEAKNRLNKPLEEERIRSREAGFGLVDYLPAHDIIRRANEIFGFDGWSGRIVDLSKELQEEQDGRWVVVYRCIYEISVGGRIQQDVGVGIATRENLADAVEHSIKYAASDGIKRALRAWGDQFGLSLYSEHREPPGSESPEEISFDYIRTLIGEGKRKWPAEKARASITEKQLTKLKQFWDDQVKLPEENLQEFLSQVTRRSISNPEELTKVEAAGILEVVFKDKEKLQRLLEDWISE